MEEERSHMTQRILDVTLEIISLLTGETFTAVKSGDLVAIMVPPFHFMMPEITDQQKLLELTNKIVELLTGKRGILSRCVATVKDEPADKNCRTRKLGHSNKEAMMEDWPIGGSDKRTPPERRLHPPHHPGDSTQVSPEIPHRGQNEDLVVVKVVDSDDEDAACMVEGHPAGASHKRTTLQRHPHHPGDTTQEHHPAGGADKRTTPKRHLHPPHHSRNSTQKGHPAGGADKRTTLEKRFPPPPRPGDSTQEHHPAGGSDKRTILERCLHPPHHPGNSTQQDQPADGFRKCYSQEINPTYLYSWDSSSEVPHLSLDSTPEQCPHPVSSRDFTMQIPPQIKSEELLVVKVGVKEEEEEEPFIEGGQKSAEEVEICLNVKVGEISAALKRDEEGDDQNYNLDDEDGTESVPEAQPISSLPEASLSRRRLLGGGKERFTCRHCGRRLTSKYNLMIHERIHTGERPFSCLDCGRTFSRKENLQNHEKLHSGHKAYPCPKCGKCFVKLAGVVRHMKTHTVKGTKVEGVQKGEAPRHKVEYISEEVPSPAHLAGSYPPRRPWPAQPRGVRKGQFWCSTCGKCFGSNFNLQVHQRVHTGERPFYCADCGRTFTRKENLKRHQVTHSGEKPYRCPDCGKHFTQKGSLLKHWRTHGDTAQYGTAHGDTAQYGTAHGDTAQYGTAHAGATQYSMAHFTVTL